MEVQAAEQPRRAGAQRELEHSRSSLAAALDATADGLLVVDLEGRITIFNAKFVELWSCRLRSSTRVMISSLSRTCSISSRIRRASSRGRRRSTRAPRWRATICSSSTTGGSTSAVPDRSGLTGRSSAASGAFATSRHECAPRPSASAYSLRWRSTATCSRPSFMTCPSASPFGVDPSSSTSS